MRFGIVLALFFVLPLWGMTQENETTINGKIVESTSQEPIGFATVLVLDTVTGKNITGGTSGMDGHFSITTKADVFWIEISFMGLEKQLIKAFTRSGGTVNLGTVALKENQQQLNEMVISAEKSRTEFKLDKRVFNVGKDLSGTGASALEVLNNVPSVDVNIEGQISLRGSQGVQILVNGMPTILASEEGNALGSITADMIEKIEVITNPSAKYDAEGTAGILNIVLKKEEKKGVNGSVTLNTGYPNNHSIGLSLNKRTEHFNLFSQLGVGHRTFPSESQSINKDLTQKTNVRSEGDRAKNETFYNVILGTDYHLNKYNVITLSGHLAFEQELEESDALFSFGDATETVTKAWKRNEITTATNPKWEYNLYYKKDFKNDKKRTLQLGVLGNYFGKDKASEFENTVLTGTRELLSQRSKTNFKEAEYTFKLDYTHPLSQRYLVETGTQYVITDVTNDFQVEDFTSGAWLANPGFTNVFSFNQKVLGAYTTLAYEGKKWGGKAGLRMEHTLLNTLLEQTNEQNKQEYINLFPSAHTSYRWSETFSMQAGYSRRIFRPHLWNLNPFFSVRNNFNISTGNPKLQPEYTDSYELTGIYLLKKVSMNLGLYHRFTQDVIEDVTRFSNTVSTTKPENIGTNNTTGIEFNIKYQANQWLTLNGDANYNYFNRKGALGTTSFDFSADRWSSKLMAKFKLKAKIDLELTGNYRSGYRTFQEEISDNLFFNLGARKKMLKGKAIISLSVRDIFASRRYQSFTQQPDFYVYSYRRRGRFITLGFSYGFGKGEAMEFSGHKRF